MRILNKELFYEQLKQFAINKLPIYISMPININSKYKINLSENRITSEKVNFNTDFNLQVLDTTKSGYNKYLCNDISFNLIKEGITSDYKLYKHINKILENLLEEQDE